jgi:glycosyltransferase involved in cell wall biosynthesis
MQGWKVFMLNLLQSAAVAFVILVFIGMMAIDLHGILKKREKENHKHQKYNPRTLVIVPCKGVDHELEKNLLSFKNQSYGNFDIVAVVDSEDDAAVQSIKKARIKSIVSDSECERCSGKVRAISTAIERFRKYEAYVIADSDIRCKSSWLEELIAPLASDRIGLSTMYPYFNPVGGFWSEVKSVWGLVGEGLMSREITKFGWGGSLAFRSDLLDKESLRFFKGSRYSVSDDICLTMITRKKYLGIAYTDMSQPVVYSKDDFSTFWEWANRQTALSILGNKYNFYLGLPFYGAESLLILSGVFLSIFVSPLFLLLLLHYLKNTVGIYRRIGEKGAYVSLITLLLPFIYVINLAVAKSMKSITWRGSRYSL